jgi:FtsP/CotA-like multicopper oxidase with cupredoxin domain
MQTIFRKKLYLSTLLLVVIALIGAGLFQGEALAALGFGGSRTSLAAINNPAACTVVTGSVTCDLYATTGTLTLPDSTVVDIWGFSDTSTGSAQLPGPTIIATEGDAVTITLHNNLAEDTALIFPGQAMIPDTVGVAAYDGITVQSKTYTFEATNPGTYLYEAGLLPNAARQVAMGMFGALVVRPASGVNHAYDAASAFDVEALVLLSEIDPDLNANPAGFDMRDFSPQYRLINGKAYPDTAEIVALAENRVLLRYVNAGIQQHTMGLLGMDQELIARDASLRPYPQRELAESIGPGRTADAIVTVPTEAGTAGDSFYTLYDTSMLLHNNDAAGFGGIMTFIIVTDGGGPPPTGPTTNSVSLSTYKAVSSIGILVSADISSDANIAEFLIDTQTGPGTTMTYNTVSGNWEGTISSDLPHGDHTVYVHGSDLTTWGAFNFAVLHIDKLGPVTSSITLAPNPSAGNVPVAISATGNDTTTGNSNIAAAEYFIGTPGLDGSTCTPDCNMNVNVAAPIASLDGTIAAGLLEGAHTIYVHSKDSFGHWGAFATTTLAVDQTGPETSNVTADPNPNNGALPYSPTIFAVRVDATLSDPLAPETNGVSSTIQQAEGFIDTIGADGEGFPLSPRDGLFNETVEDAYVYIPLSTINTLAEGTHPIWIHGQDTSGNWGDAVAVDLLIVKTSPTVYNVVANPNPTAGAVNVTLTATAAGPGTDITMAEFYIDIDPDEGNGTLMTVTANGAVWDLSATVNVSGLIAGDHTLFVRARDAAGNWSQTDNVIVTVETADAIFADSFETDFSPWSALTGNVAVTTAAAMDGMYGMEVTIAGNTPGYVTDLSPVLEPSYHARFYFNPNGTLTGNTQQDIFVGQDANGTDIFKIQFRRRNQGGGTYQVQGEMLVTLPNGKTSMQATSWYVINNNAANWIEIAWSSSPNASFDLFINDIGTPQETLNGDTSAYLLEEVWLGPSAGLVNNASGTMYFDAFESTRTSLIGPFVP